MRIAAVVFDLGGTLIEYAGSYETWPDLETPGFTAAYDYLKQQSLCLPDFHEFHLAGFEMLPGRWQQATAGQKNLRLVDLLREVLHECGADQARESWLEEAAERYQAAVRAQAEPVEGGKETLSTLKSQGYKLGLLSNTMFTGVAHREDLARFNLMSYFDALLFSADENKWKPNAEPFLHVLEALEVAPQTAVYVGDDPANDVVGGRRAGMRTVYYRSSDRFHVPEGVEPHAQIQNLHELVPLLSRWAKR